MREATNRREFIRRAVSASLAPALFRGLEGTAALAGPSEASGGKVLLQPFNYEGVRLLDGMLKKQYEQAHDYYLKIPDDNILKGFRVRAGLPAPGQAMGGWCQRDCGVTFGQWLSGMARMSKATGDVAMRDKATHLMREWAKTIAPDGTWCYVDETSHAHYEFDKMVCGLVDLYAYGGWEEAIPPLEKITDWARTRFDRTCLPANPRDISAGASGGEWYTLSENLYRAYQLTGNPKYREFGDVWHYPQYWGMFTGKVPLDVHGLHAYSHVNTLSSAALTYAVTGDPEYLKTIVNAYEFLQRTQWYATGGYGPSEQLQAPDGSLGRALEEEPTRVWPSLPGRSFEVPCGSWAGFKLARYLMMFTGEARYGDWIEKLVYNAFGAALPMTTFSIVGTGQTFYYADYRVGGGTKEYFHDAWPCCSGTYIQCVADYHNVVYLKDATGLYVNLFVPSEVTWDHKGTQIKIIQETAYPESNTTTLRVQVANGAPFTLAFRVPGWARGVTARVNESPVEVAAIPGTWARIKRTWQSGDRVTIQVPMQLAYAPVDQQHPHRVALTYGPVVLVREQERVAPGSRTDPTGWLTPGERPLEFVAAAAGRAAFVPFYRVGYGTPYCMYFDLIT